MNRIRAHRKLTIGFSIGLAIALAAFAAISLDAGSAVNPKSPVTLATLMGKMESLQSQMQENARTTEAMRAALEQQRSLNTRLLSLLAVPSAGASSALAPNPLPAPPARLRLAIGVCAKGGYGGAGKLTAKIGGEGALKGQVGALVFGNGGEGGLEAKAGAEAAFEGGSAYGVEATACIEGFETDLDPATAQQLLLAFANEAAPVANELANAFLNDPKLQKISGGIQPLKNLQLNLNKDKVLAGAKDPGNFFTDFQTISNVLPFPGNTGSLIQNPTSLFPAINDFDVNNLCSGTQAGTLFDDMCIRAQGFTSPLVPISNVLTNVDTKVDNFINNINGVTSNVTTLFNDVGSLQVGATQLNTQVTNLETGVTSLCNGLNSRITTIRNGVVSFPARNFSLDLGAIGTFSIPVDILRNDQPFAGLSSVGCPTF